MSTQHTPGPWKPYMVSPSLYAIHGDARTISESTIATVSFGMRAEKSQEQADNARANARLIAAAPDLLVALENLLYEPMAERTVDAAKRALAKAKGA